VVSVQEAAWLPPRYANDATPSGVPQPHSVVEGQSDAGKSDFLDRHIYWAKSSLLSVLDHLID
jgi:hypothetical protein